MRSLVIIPTYNERENLESLLKGVLAADLSVDVLIVDDNSPDGTGELADGLAAVSNRVHVLHRASKLGLGTAYRAGFKYALARDYERIIEMDADFSHRPADLPRLLLAAMTEDVVIGSRNVPGGRAENWSPLRHLVSKGGSLYARFMLSLPVRDCTSGFKCFRREVLECLDLDDVRSNGYAFQVEMNYLCHRAGFRITEVPIIFPDRKQGRSKMSKRIVIEAAALVWQLRRQSASTRVIGRNKSFDVARADPTGQAKNTLVVSTEGSPAIALVPAGEMQPGREQ
ncbi:MAG: polyprenol monophosphomannose synthase [Gammaproteobacteria bacterium]|nr:polyprenol monophosphomannose synthase [Gammaproteobacteria bacterium]